MSKHATTGLRVLAIVLYCIKYECCMCGSNHRDESDRRPLWFCPECAAKVWWATGADPAKRYSALAELCEKHKLAAESEFYKKSAAILEPTKEPFRN